jgi:hypothetical protein
VGDVTKAQGGAFTGENIPYLAEPAQQPVYREAKS